MRRPRFIIVLALAIGSQAAVPGLAAAGVAHVSPGACLGTSHHKNVAAGSTITISGGWGERDLALERYFVHVETTTLTINGSTTNVSGLYAPIQTVPTQYGPAYFSSYDYATGITLANPGDSMVFTEAISVDWYYPLFGPVIRTGPERFAVPGETISSIFCVVTAT